MSARRNGSGVAFGRVSLACDKGREIQESDLPDTRIICIPLYDEVAWAIVGAGGHDHHIAPLRILGTDDGGFVGFAEAAV